MCGIGGKIAFGARPDAGLGEEMAACMTHRGPDDAGVYASGPAVLAHRRLSILDLSDAGHQPMSTPDGAVHVVFNGEIYNYRELRERLDGYTFRSGTDTEVLLYLYAEYGLDCLSMLRGMFAFAIWDERAGRLFLARDRLGQKPLFYRREDGTFWFGSTVKAILADDAVAAEPDLPAIRSYLTYNFVPHPHTGFDGIRQLAPAEYMVVTEGGTTRETYWRPSHANQFTDPPSVLADRLRSELREATRLRMRSDVPVGVFLSGGLDSSVTTALMCEVADAEVETYSIGFDEGAYDELAFARSVAGMYDTDHTEYTVTPDSLEVLPELVEHYEMPFGDPSAVPTYYVSQVASDDITVALTGDAGDENFAGYDRYTFDRLTSWARAVPRPVRAATGRGLSLLSAAGVGSDRLRRARRLLETADGDPVERYVGYIYVGADGLDGHVGRRVWSGPEPDDQLSYLREAFERADGPTRLDRLMGVDMTTYLPDDPLVKVDRASMAHSLEIRSPFLDHRLIEFASRVPARYKWRYGRGKWLLKRAFRDALPERVLSRSKQGFGVPVNEWFRDELREFARERLARLGEREPFDGAAARRTMDRHVDGEADLGGDLWNLVMLEAWYERFID